MNTKGLMASLLILSNAACAAPDYRKYDEKAKIGPRVECYEETEHVRVFWIFEGHTDLVKANDNPKEGGHLIFNMPVEVRDFEVGGGLCSHDIGANMRTARNCESGKVQIESISESGEAIGTYSLMLEGGSEKSGKFVAPVCPWSYEKWLEKNS